MYEISLYVRPVNTCIDLGVTIKWLTTKHTMFNKNEQNRQILACNFHLWIANTQVFSHDSYVSFTTFSTKERRLKHSMFSLLKSYYFGRKIMFLAGDYISS